MVKLFIWSAVRAAKAGRQVTRRATSSPSFFYIRSFNLQTSEKMEFIDEEARPRFLFQSRVSSSSLPNPEPLYVNKFQLAICAAASLATAVVTFLFAESTTLQCLFFWVAMSLLLGPLAPISHTGGEIRVGVGEIAELPDQDPAENEEPKRVNPSRRSKVRKADGILLNSPAPVANPVITDKSEKKTGNAVSNAAESAATEEKEWVEEDLELLKKLILKHPVGEPRRWELIAEAFRGRYGLDSVIKMAKSMSEKRVNGEDPFAQFLKQRKPLDKRVEAGNGVLPAISKENGDSKKVNEKEGESSSWTSGEDLALLSALKAFPKDTSMRWEKIAAAVPRKSKAACMKRVALLKRDFRDSKASETGERD
ncbi:transcription factor MAMYB-like [Aristolochia californica]|uniref:transcription factor MAMYB-like n=1 Tax=Aristolochia californica TaxID=171875 RepID=UPI0035D94CED